LELSISGCDDFVWISAPHEGLGFTAVMLGNEALDCGLQVNDRMKHAVLQPSAGEFGEEALNRVQTGEITSGAYRKR